MSDLKSYKERSKEAADFKLEQRLQRQWVTRLDYRKEAVDACFAVMLEVMNAIGSCI